MLIMNGAVNDITRKRSDQKKNTNRGKCTDYKFYHYFPFIFLENNKKEYKSQVNHEIGLKNKKEMKKKFSSLFCLY